MWIKHDSLIDTWPKSFVDWYIVFEHGDMDYWWAKFLQSGFRHCYALRWDGFNWIAFYPRLGHTDIVVLDYVHAEDIENIYLDTNCSVIIHAKVWRETVRIRSPWPTVITCVEQIKAILGINKWSLFTPYKLFKYLLEKEHGQDIRWRRRTSKIRSTS
jgi:hypothetical protein